MRSAEPASFAPTEVPRKTDDGAQPGERNPWLLGLLCFLVFALPSYVVVPGPLKSNGSPARMIAVLLFGLVVFGFVMARRSGHAPRWSPGALILLVYFLLSLSTFGVGLRRLDPTPGWLEISASMTRSLIGLVANVGLGLYIIARVRTDRQRNFVLGWLAVGLTFSCFVAVLQAFTKIDLRYLFQPPGFVLNSEDLNFASRDGLNRAMGTSHQAIEFSVHAVAALVLAIYFARHARTRNGRLLSAAAALLAILAMPTAISRTGVIALAAALLVLMLVFTVRHLANGVIVAALAVGAYSVAFPRILNALWNTIVNAKEDPSVLGRTADYAQVSQTFREYPLFGLGLGASPPDVYGLLDNQWLQAIVQGGLVGVTAMLVLAGGGVFGLAAALRSAATRREREQAYTLGAMFAAILASSSTFDLFGFQQSALLFFIVFGLLWSSYADSVRPTT